MVALKATLLFVHDVQIMVAFQTTTHASNNSAGNKQDDLPIQRPSLHPVPVTIRRHSYELPRFKQDFRITKQNTWPNLSQHDAS